MRHRPNGVETRSTLCETHSNQSRGQRTDLSRRLRDGVSLSILPSFLPSLALSPSFPFFPPPRTHSLQLSICWSKHWSKQLFEERRDWLKIAERRVNTG